MNMKSYDEKFIIQYLKNLTNSLMFDIRKLLNEQSRLSEEVQIGADGEPTTYIDKYAEEFLIKGITKKFKCKVMSEEMGIKSFGNDGLLFVIDPIDGTTNAKNRLPFFSSSIAVLNDNKLVAGLVRDLYNGDCFYAIKNQGSYYNSKKISAESFNDLKGSIFLISRPLSENDMKTYKRIALSCGSHRILGCPSLEICYVASGKAYAAVQIHQKPNATMMDIAAAKLILEEAGGILLNQDMKMVDLVEDPAYRINFVACQNTSEAKKKIFELFRDG